MMNVWVRIGSGLSEDNLDMAFSGQIEEESGRYSCFWTENRADGESVESSLFFALEEKEISLSRKGEQSVDLLFSENRKKACLVKTKYGDFPAEIFTHRAEILEKKEKEGFLIFLEYDMIFEGMEPERNRIEMDISFSS